MKKKTLVAYIRVSTARQGERGVSLQEQRDAIIRHARKHEYRIDDWYVEKETAAKRGRPQFAKMLKALKSGKAAGVVIHKIDRGSRNLKDWADLGELIDEGITVRFAIEDIDLSSRGGRLSADIQAVVAADFIRNLREETRKGFYGRLKQGLYPLAAPIGYLDMGGGKPKIPDPAKAPLVRRIFELYSTGQHSFFDLEMEAKKIGLTNRTGKPILRSRLTDILNNPFYMGVIRLKDGQTFRGIHNPIVTANLFRSVQEALRGRTNTRVIVHNFLYRRLFACSHCSHSLIGERQKGNIYYRCHTKGCPTKGVRENALERAVYRSLKAIEFNREERQYAYQALNKLIDNWKTWAEEGAARHRRTRDKIQDRLNRLTDAFLDTHIDRDSYLLRKEGLLNEQRQVDDYVDLLEGDAAVVTDGVREFLELAGSASHTYRMATTPEKREMLKIVTSNRTVDRKNVVITHSLPFSLIASRARLTNGLPSRDVPRTEAGVGDVWEKIMNQLADFIRAQRAERSEA